MLQGACACRRFRMSNVPSLSSFGGEGWGGEAATAIQFAGGCGGGEGSDKLSQDWSGAGRDCWGRDCWLTFETRRGLCAKMAHWRAPSKPLGPLLSPSVPPPYTLPTQIVTQSVPFWHSLGCLACWKAGGKLVGITGYQTK